MRIRLSTILILCASIPLITSCKFEFQKPPLQQTGKSILTLPEYEKLQDRTIRRSFINLSKSKNVLVKEQHTLIPDGGYKNFIIVNKKGSRQFEINAFHGRELISQDKNVVIFFEHYDPHHGGKNDKIIILNSSTLKKIELSTGHTIERAELSSDAALLFVLSDHYVNSTAQYNTRLKVFDTSTGELITEKLFIKAQKASINYQGNDYSIFIPHPDGIG